MVFCTESLFHTFHIEGVAVATYNSDGLGIGINPLFPLRISALGDWTTLLTKQYDSSSGISITSSDVYVIANFCGAHGVLLVKKI